MKTKKIVYWALLIICIIGVVTSIMLVENENIDETIGTFMVLLNCGGMVAWAYQLIKLDENTPITEKYLNSLKSIGREQDGSYSDRWHITIIPDHLSNKNRWRFCIFSEVDGSNTFVKYVSTKVQLKKIYNAVTDKELE